jgi:hypothetical protein
MTAVIDQVKAAALTGAGINLLVTDALVGREVPAPKFAEAYVASAREQANEALTGLRGRTEAPALKAIGRLPEPIADAMITGRTAAWDRLGIDAPAPTKKTAPAKATKSAGKAKKAPATKA